jgi:hypothetical protein
MKAFKSLVAIALLLLAGQVFAQADDKTVSSVSCRGYGLNTSDAELTFQNAGLYNSQNTYETVICPILMDQEGGWGTTALTNAVDIAVSFRIGATPTKAGCTLYRTSGTTTTAIGGYTAPSNYSANTLQTINFSNTATTFDGNGITMICTMGPKVAMTAINTQEWLQTGIDPPL